MRAFSLLLCLWALPAAALGQGTAADYQRAATLDARTQGKVFRANVAPVWADDGESLHYTVDLPGGAKEHVVVDLAKGERRAVSAEAWAKLPKPAKPVEPQPRPSANRGPRRSNVSPDGKWRVEVADDNLVLREVATKAETTLTKEGKKADAYTGEVFWSPDSAK